MKRMIDSDKIKVNNNGEVEINANVVVNGEMSFPDGEQSTKKIYYHPIEIFKADVCLLSGTILNNDPTPITSWNTIKNIIASWAGEGSYARFNINGGWNDSDNSRIVITSEIIYVKTGNKYVLTGTTTNGVLLTAATGLDITNETFTQINDDVNAVN